MPKDFVTKLRAGSPFAIFAATVKQRIAQDDAAKQREREAKQAKAEAERRKLTAFKTAMKNQVAKLERAERRERNPAAEIREANAMSDALTAARTAEAEADDALAIFFSAQRKIQGLETLPLSQPESASARAMLRVMAKAAAPVDLPSDPVGRAIVLADQKRRGEAPAPVPTDPTARAIIAADRKRRGLSAEDPDQDDDTEDQDEDDLNDLARKIIEADKRRRGVN